MTAHIRHSGDLTWQPYFWAWAYEGTKAINSFDGWPGQKQTEQDEKGWYTTTFKTPGGLDYYFLINLGSGKAQSKDIGPIAFDDYKEIWIVIDDAAFTADDISGKWITYYDHDPDIA